MLFSLYVMKILLPLRHESTMNICNELKISRMHVIIQIRIFSLLWRASTASKIIAAAFFPFIGQKTRLTLTEEQACSAQIELMPYFPPWNYHYKYIL